MSGEKQAESENVRKALEILKKQHQELDEAINNALENPLDDLALLQLKRRKLQIKDEIARLRLMSGPHGSGDGRDN
jgi:hypothetical protein